MEDKNKKKSSLIVVFTILLVASVSFTLSYFTAQLSGDNATTVKVSSKAQTSLIFNKGDDLVLDLGIDNFYDGAGNVVAVTNPSVSLTAPEEVTEKYNVYFDITTNEFVYTVDSSTPELVLTILDEESTPVESITTLTYVTVGSGDSEIKGFDITETTGLFEVLLENDITVDNGTTTDNWTFTLTFVNLDTDQVLNTGKNFEAEIILGEGAEQAGYSLHDEILLANGDGAETVEDAKLVMEAKVANFTKAAVSQEFYDSSYSQEKYTVENGMYAIDDDYGTSYYYRGAVDNNLVKFGGYYWRIIRIDGNGGIKLIYSGSEVTGPATTGADTQISTSAFNSSYDKSVYTGYVYETGVLHGTTTDSTIKEAIDTWYNDNLLSYASSLENTNFCIDRTAYTSNSFDTEITSKTFTGSEFNAYYGAYKRLESNKIPSLKCDNSSDILNLESGLVSADEIALAGGEGTIENPYVVS